MELIEISAGVHTIPELNKIKFVSIKDAPSTVSFSPLRRNKICYNIKQ